MITTLGALVAALTMSAPWLLALLGLVGLGCALRHPRAVARLRRRITGVGAVAIVAVGLRVFWDRGATPHAGLGLGVPCEALVLGAVLALRIVSAAIWTTWLTLSLPPTEIDRALAQLGVPPGLVELLAQTRRFGAQLRATQQSALTAAALRGGFASTRATATTTGRIAGVILVRALDRADRVALAMALRGQDTAPREAVIDRGSSARLVALVLALLALGVWLGGR